MLAAKQINIRNKGATLILSMIFVLVFSALAMSLASLSGSNLQIASNQHQVNTALYAAQSGLECAKCFISGVTLPQTDLNYVTDTQAETAWDDLCQHIRNQAMNGHCNGETHQFSDAHGSGDELAISAMSFGSSDTTFSLRFYRYEDDPRTILVESTGAMNGLVRRVKMQMNITKDREVLNYAIASRGRMWLTGDTTIHGDLFSSWDRASVAPYNMTSDSTVLGTINTVLTLDQIDAQRYDLETLDANDNPVDANGNPLGTNYGDRYYGPYDEVQAYHRGINYGQTSEYMPGMDISDYDTDDYATGLSSIPSTSHRVTEYFPHAAGNYSSPSSSGSLRLTRSVYENQTFSNAMLPCGRQALFKNCTFEGVLYVDCYKTSTSSTSYTNNVRFEDCTFNGVIVTDVPQPFNWQRNCLYFTGAATFNNESSIQEATILAPHFNVDLGNTNPEQNDNNVLTGAIVGGIVDIRGNAQIYGTIISMFDTTSYTSGYVTNIGATLDDGGSETTELGDIGVISITPEEEMMLPSGITSPIIIKPDPTTYSESV